MTTTRPGALLFAALILGAAALSACSSSGAPAAPVTSVASSGVASVAPSSATDPNAPGTDPTATPAAIAGADPCSLITDAQAATVFGGPAKHAPGGSVDASNGNGVTVTATRCEWDEVTSSQLGYDLWVAVYAGADRAYFDDASGKGTPIAGLGDAASAVSNEVWVISKGTVLHFYGSLPGTDGLQKAAALAVGSL